MKIGDRLYAKDGRKMGNAKIHGISKFLDDAIYDIRTDYGNYAVLNKEEIDKVFYLNRDESEDNDGNSQDELQAINTEMLEALEECVTELMVTQANIRIDAKTNNKWEGVVELMQLRIDDARSVIAKAKGDK